MQLMIVCRACMVESTNRGRVLQEARRQRPAMPSTDRGISPMMTGLRVSDARGLPNGVGLPSDPSFAFPSLDAKDPVDGDRRSLERWERNAALPAIGSSCAMQCQ